MAPFQIDFAVALGVVALLGLTAFGTALLYYRSTVPPVAPMRRATLTGLRTLGIGLIVLLLCEPVLHVRFSHTSPPALAVLVDNSRSMRLVDRQGDRAAELRTALENPALARLAGRAEVRYFSFGAGLKPWNRESNDTLPLNEGVTDIAGGLRSLAEEKERRHIDAAVLLSDGVYTLGRDPLHDAQQLGLSLFTVDIGESSEQKDLVVTRTAANELVYADTRAPVSVTVRSSGFDGERVEVTLSEGGRVLDRAPLTLEQGTRDYTVDLSYLPQGEHREPSQYTPELSRRARGVEIWAALKSLGRSGLADLIQRNCRLARRFAEALQQGGCEILNEVVLNQVLVSFGEAARTRQVIERVQRDGTCWCGPTEWQGRAAMRISVSSWATRDEDVERSVAAILRAAVV